MTEILTLREIAERYPDQWICVEVTQWDGPGQPAGGQVIAHDTNRDETMRAWDQLRAAHPDSIVYSYYTGPLIPEGLAVILVAP